MVCFVFLESIKDLENEKLSLQSDTEQYSDQVVSTVYCGIYYNTVPNIFPLCINQTELFVQAQRLQQKLQIMTEMYQENELKLHRSRFI